MYQTFDKRPFSPDNPHVLAFCDAPLLLWLPESGFTPGGALLAHQRVSLAVALSPEGGRFPFLIANLCDQHIVELTAPSPLAAVCGTPERPGDALDARQLVLRARRWHLVADYWGQELEFKEVSALKEDWLPGPGMEVQLPQALWPAVLR